ncbi:DNA repair and recombination protein RAD54 and RAD54-like protein [Babesia microti strain RI]|uniref:DNA repair and recombination protein RAD54 and RAD54-like protein n=1 Tax=Babesia microti (strain RI) TaxID=1133968 RepID=A0A1R4AC75_BABMR|nr:DNA repair and recombination protein RAD54 and RAD54-like protein [Babesia microti strain RI]SJK86612.1 DNA repair and recombination protein RAD54 and RAD54-like protein [Babesia microti strain RI]|eukprot:XP_021338749.1 DNA repair and recombination protein RAD54 and RAD54-like protein [Babesia microti strain RI]
MIAIRNYKRPQSTLSDGLDTSDRYTSHPLNSYDYSICLIRAPLLSLLSVENGPTFKFKPFKSPLQGHVPGSSAESQRKTLGCKIKSLNNYSCRQFIKSSRSNLEIDDVDYSDVDPLVLYTPSPESKILKPVVVDPMLSKHLRDHQREGVQFVFDCLSGLKKFDGQGCILADDMGLGKTLQSITVMWTLLNQGITGKPAARKCAIICPATLVSNWESEIAKWLKGRCPCTAVSDNSREKVVSKFQGFKYDYKSRVIISSYETFRLHVDKLEGVPIDIIICDEAHRLKNDKAQSTKCIINIPAKMRLLLSGTPIQNDLNEFYALVSICNPNALGDINYFRKTYANPIVNGRSSDISSKEYKLAELRLKELSDITNQFVLRRTNALLSKLLPPKITMNVFCNMTPIQQTMYDLFTTTKILYKKTDSKIPNKGLLAIKGLMALCNHPFLISDPSKLGIDGLNDMIQELKYASNGRSKNIRYDLSGKLYLLYCLLHEIKWNTDDKVVIVSYYTQTLSLIKRLCRECNYTYTCLDGSVPPKKRHALVTKFNDPFSDIFVFLLSSKAGGAGVNLIGANRLIMFDPDWNPAFDYQALARIWRDGQRKVSYIYRLFCNGTIEEKILQRQLSKGSLSSMLVTDGQNEIVEGLSMEDLRDIFTLKTNTLSNTHDTIGCKNCTDKSYKAQDVDFDEKDLNTWAHHSDIETLPDEILRNAATRIPETLIGTISEPPKGYRPVSFVFSCYIDFKQQTIQHNTDDIKNSEDESNLVNTTKIVAKNPAKEAENVVNVVKEPTRLREKERTRKDSDYLYLEESLFSDSD